MDKWINQIDQTTREFQHSFGSLTEDELNWKPSPEVWSIAQNIDHLIVINQSYFPILADLRSGNLKLPYIARFKVITSFLGRLVLSGVHPDRKKKSKTFSIWEPETGHIAPDIMGRFSTHQDRLKSEIKASKEWIESDAVIHSPANRNIVYKLEAAFDIIVHHEQRHLAQAQTILASRRKV
ncbi:MAG: DinB family protein [Balneolaceae bacterium]|nr:DinB family protein [Balneolaceae bacterium]